MKDTLIDIVCIMIIALWAGTTIAWIIKFISYGELPTISHTIVFIFLTILMFPVVRRTEEIKQELKKKGKW